MRTRLAVAALAATALFVAAAPGLAGASTSHWKPKPSRPTIVELAVKTPQLSILVAAVQKAGLDPYAMPMLHDRKIAAAGFDGDGEAIPHNVDGISFPIHCLGINAMGLHFMDSLNLEDLAAVCAAAGRSSFACVIAPLRLVGGTGTVVNPIAIF